MRRRMALATTLLVLALLAAGTGLVAWRSFALSMERERERALSEEAAVARAVALELAGADEARMRAVAQSAQGRYGSDSLRVQLLQNGAPLAGAGLPGHAGIRELIACEGRATLLYAKRLYVAHRLSDELTLLLCSDVSPLYALRGRIAAWAAAVCAAGAGLGALLSAWLSGWLTRPVRMLASAARALEGGAYDTPLPRAGNDEAGELTRAFAAMAEAVREREEALRQEAERRQELIDALAHEMRTPLTSLVAGADLLRRAALPERERDALLCTMAREASRLAGMDERLLLLTRLSHEPMQRYAFSSMEMAREALAVFDGVTLSGEDARFFAERELTIELLRNLVVNALRAGGDAPVTVTLAPDGFTVEDRGCGMTREEAARAFDPFYKADKARARGAGGAGLGLTLCARIAALHGGTLHIDSAPGRGTRVVYHFVTTP